MTLCHRFNSNHILQALFHLRFTSKALLQLIDNLLLIITRTPIETQFIETSVRIFTITGHASTSLCARQLIDSANARSGLAGCLYAFADSELC